MKKNHRHVSMGFSDQKFREGHHIIYIYNDDVERKRTMAKYFRQGFLENDKALYLIDDISPEEMRKELIDLGVNPPPEETDFDLRKGHYALCPGATFSPEFMLAVVGEYYDQAIQEGYAGARGAGEMSWALVEGRATVPDLLEYEARLTDILADHPLTTVCQYDARKFDGALIMDMLSVHPMMIVRGQLVNNPSYAKKEIFLREYRERMDRNRRSAE